MNTFETDPEFDLFLYRDFFDAPTRTRLLAEMRACVGGAASVYGYADAGAVNDRVRRTTRVVLSRETTEFVTRELWERRRAVERHFGVSFEGCEEPQFLRYGVGDFFVAHQDGNTGVLLFDRERARKVSTVIFLSSGSAGEEDEGDHDGDSLAFHNWGVGVGRAPRSLALRGEAGALVAFRAETTHEVTPVTRGERYSIACWYR